MITMTRSGSVRAMIPTESPQPVRKAAARAAGRPKAASSPAVLAGSTERAATRGGGEVIELECGITVYRPWVLLVLDRRGSSGWSEL
jgi:hypothetical protein